MAVRQYIGARYVAKIYVNSLDPSSADWESGVAYEPLTMVTYNSSSYISRKAVAATVGNPAANPEYWAVTGLYNGQIAQLQNDVGDLQTDLSGKFLSKGETLISANADGVKTVGDLITELVTQVAAFVSGKLYKFVQMNIEGNIMTAHFNQIISGVYSDCKFSVSTLSASDVIIDEAFLSATPYFYINAGGTAMDYTNAVANANAYILIETFEYIA